MYSRGTRFISFNQTRERPIEICYGHYRHTLAEQTEMRKDEGKRACEILRADHSLRGHDYANELISIIPDLFPELLQRTANCIIL